ncbi:MAG: hypothetical protein OJJ54_11385 [Pseudonocardia sp.]|nr:hypothetical protein [Pseudonocardia sp.]
MSVHLTPSGVNPEETRGPGVPPAPSPGRVRLAGLLLAAGAAAWAVGTVIVGDRIQEGIHALDTITGMAFLVGVAALALLVLATRATGAGKGRALPVVLLVVLAGAFVLNAASFGYATHDEFPAPLMILDACWPLGQLLLLVLGVAVAVVGRYRGLLRWQPLLCGLWFPVSMVAQILLGSTASVYASAAWLVVAHCVLGVRLVLRPGVVAG